MAKSNKVSIPIFKCMGKILILINNLLSNERAIYCIENYGWDFTQFITGLFVPI